MLTVAIQYPSFGPQHPPRLEAIVKACPFSDGRVVAMEMFSKDSDYEWRPIQRQTAAFVRHTVMDCTSVEGRNAGGALKQAVWGALDEISPDVLVVNGWGHRESRCSLAWCRRRGCAIVMLSDSVRENLPRWWWKEAVKKWLLRGINAGFAAGTPQARYLEYLGLPRAGIFYPGSCVVDNAYWAAQAERIRREAAAQRQRLGLPERYFLCVARFLDLKNIPFLVRAYALFRRRSQGPPCGLVLCGSGPDEGRIRDAIRETGAPDVILAGFCQVDELPYYYSLASCFVLPSVRFECWGLVVNEAMASGLPVLVSRMVGCAEDLVRDGCNGYKFDPRDEEQLAGQLAAVNADESMNSRMAAESRKLVAGHSLEVAAANLWLAVKRALAQ